MAYDLIVIGSGPGGYGAAIRAGQLGLKTALIEKDPVPGGTCLNVGCIPSKALLDSSGLFYEATHKFQAAGIQVSDPSFDWEKIQKNKDRVVTTNVKGVAYLLKKNKVDWIQGTGSLASGPSVEVVLADGSKQTLETKQVLLATGSYPTPFPGTPFDTKNHILSSTEMLSLSSVPEKLVVIGGGVIGLELGSVYSRLGSEVTVIEGAPRILPAMDEQVSVEMTKILKKQGIKIFPGSKVTAIDSSSDGVSVQYETGSESVNVAANECLVAIGRKPMSEGLDPGKTGLQLDEKGFVQVDSEFRTSILGVYAIGDLIGGMMLAHKAKDEGVYVAERIAGQKPPRPSHLIPGVIYTHPEAAGVGETEEQLKSRNVGYRSGVFPYMALGRARASGDTDGFIKILSDETTDEILGVHILGERAADMIAEAVVAMEYKASAEDIARICHAHPTFSEGIQEAALEASGIGALHK